MVPIFHFWDAFSVVQHGIPRFPSDTTNKEHIPEAAVEKGPGQFHGTGSESALGSCLQLGALLWSKLTHQLTGA